MSAFEDNVKYIMSKYNLKQHDAISLLNSLKNIIQTEKQAGVESSEAEKLLSLAIPIKQDYDRKLPPQERGMSWYIAFQKAKALKNSNKIIGMKKNAPNDRRDTQRILKTHPGGKRVIEDEFGNKVKPSKKSVPTHKHLIETDNSKEIIVRRSKAPKYYYFDDNGQFNVMGYDAPPGIKYTRFRPSAKDAIPYEGGSPPPGYENYPYAMVREIAIRGSPKHRQPEGKIIPLDKITHEKLYELSKAEKKFFVQPNLDKPGEFPVIGDWIIGTGQRDIILSFYYGNKLDSSERLSLEFKSTDKNFNSIINNEFVNNIQTTLKAMAIIARGRPSQKEMKHNFSKALQEREAREIQRKYEEYYLDPYLEKEDNDNITDLERLERRKRRSKILKRKKVIKKPLQKKCVCDRKKKVVPKKVSQKRKIIKKIVRRVKKK